MIPHEYKHIMVLILSSFLERRFISSAAIGQTLTALLGSTKHTVTIPVVYPKTFDD